MTSWLKTTSAKHWQNVEIKEEKLENHVSNVIYLREYSFKFFHDKRNAHALN